jgi:hypothetical protein
MRLVPGARISSFCTVSRPNTYAGGSLAGNDSSDASSIFSLSGSLSSFMSQPWELERILLHSRLHRRQILGG